MSVQPATAQAQPEQIQELSFLERIIDKKINRVPLSCFEAIVDWFLTAFSCCYPGYKKLYDEKVVSYKHFPDGTPVEDRTVRKIIEIKHQQSEGIRLDDNVQFAGGLWYDSDYLAAGDYKIYFTGLENKEVLFGSKYNTERVIVEEATDDREKLLIKEVKKDGTLKQFTVDISTIYLRQYREGMVGYYELVYLTEEARVQIEDPGYLHAVNPR